MFIESESVELKEILKEDILKEVVAFANTSGGTIYVGIDNDGNELGVQDVDKTYTSLTNLIRDGILPDVTLFTRCELIKEKIIKVTVSEGSSKPYYLKKNGIKPSGVYVRQGPSSVGATWEQIRQFIKYSDGDSFELARSMEQNLTFNEAVQEFKNRGVEFAESKYVTLGIKDAEKNLFTNLAWLISDQCTHSVKVAVFEDAANTIFLDRQEFKGSVFKQLNDTFNYLKLNNRTISTIKGLDRIDSMDYPPETIREALINALIHRSYSFSGSIIININKERMEFISLGGLVAGLTPGDIMAGVSLSRNPSLCQVFSRLKHIEAYGTGIRRIYEAYKSCDVLPIITVTENSFKIELPNMNFKGRESYRRKSGENKPVKLTTQMQVILDNLAEKEYLTEDDFMDLLDVKRTRAYIISKQMIDMNLIDIVGRGKGKKFVLHD